MNPFYLQHLYERLGKPRWFWASVFLAMFVLWGIAGAVCPEIEA